MLSSIHLSNPPHFCKSQSFPLLCHDRSFNPRARTPTRRVRFNVNAIETNPLDPIQPNENQKQQLRTLFPGGFKRPEIKVPTIVLNLNAAQVLKRDEILDYVDVVVSQWVQIVVLNGGNGSGGDLYEAARLLKSLIRDRAYMMIAERVDIATAVGASGVLLSDQGLPAIVARNMMIESKSKSVLLPIVARYVETANAAISASNSEGADFVIYGVDEGKFAEVLLSSVIQNIKVPVFTTITLGGQGLPFNEASKLLQSGAGGLVLSFEDMKLLTDESLRKLFSANTMNKRVLDKFQSSSKLDKDKAFSGKKGITGFIKLEDREKQLIEMERMVLLEAVSVIRRAAPLMDEVSLLTDAVSHLDDPFLLVIVGEFNSGKSSVINALLGQKYLNEGVVPTTNEITLLRNSEMDNMQERCERHPDGQFICYLPAPILKEMNLVDTPGTNVILQRQQRLTEEFVPRADLILFVISADRPLTESEVTFLRYIQQWKKKVVFVLNKSDLYQNTSELDEAVTFIKENVRKLLNTDSVSLYPVSARLAIEAKISLNPVAGRDHEELLASDSRWRSSGFSELEAYLFSFLDGSTDTGLERMKLKLGTPIGISDRVIAAGEVYVRTDFESANQDLVSVNNIVTEVKEYKLKMENESMSWKRQTLSLIDSAKSRAVRLVESTLQLSNLDLVASYVFKGDKTGLLPATSSLQNDIIGPAYSDVQKLLGEYLIWLQSNYAREGRLYKEACEKRWPSFANRHGQIHSNTYKLLEKKEELSMKVLENFSAAAAVKLFEQEIREVILGTFGGLGAAGLSASLLTSVLPTTLEDLLALGLCSAGGLLAISNFPTRRKEVAEKVRRTADALAREIEDAMQRDLMQSTEDLENFVKLLTRPYQDAAQQRVDSLLKVQEELTDVEKKLQNLQLQIENLRVP